MYMSDNAPELLLIFTTSKPANGISRRVACDHLFQALVAETSRRHIETSLNDGEQVLLMRTSVRLDTAIQPPAAKQSLFTYAYTNTNV